MAIYWDLMGFRGDLVDLIGFIGDLLEIPSGKHTKNKYEQWQSIVY